MVLAVIELQGTLSVEKCFASPFSGENSIADVGCFVGSKRRLKDPKSHGGSRFSNLRKGRPFNHLGPNTP